ncbi:hypothetical protein GYMLUDRAFT_56524 [Collybiopsis luxurians FD-317 M1]|nr:hypothetical protein GYMLUDRAFT_56524 [Collybiopsis luxurians FD-317 M1]
MFKSISALSAFILNASLVSSLVVSIPRAAAPATAHRGPISDLAQSSSILVLTSCTQVNLADCLTFTAQSLPVGCTSLIANGQGNSVQSAATPSGVECTLFTGEACTGTTQLVNGTIDDLSDVGFDKLANSFTCQAS